VSFKPFIVTFEYSTPDRAQMYVIAQTPEQAAEGMLETLPSDYQNVRVIDTVEYKPPTVPTLN
jgi:hypothetical protein